MKLDPRVVSKPLVAVLALVLIAVQTTDSLRRTGSWKSNPLPKEQADDPLLEFEARLARTDPIPPLANLRDPLAFGVAPAADPRRNGPGAAAPAPPPAPVLTAIIWDNDPRASIRWDGRDYSVRVNSQFSDYQVLSISRDQVVLAHGGQLLVLRFPRRGE